MPLPPSNEIKKFTPNDFYHFISSNKDTPKIIGDFMDEILKLNKLEECITSEAQLYAIVYLFTHQDQLAYLEFLKPNCLKILRPLLKNKTIMMGYFISKIKTLPDQIIEHETENIQFELISRLFETQCITTMEALNTIFKWICDDFSEKHDYLYHLFFKTHRDLLLGFYHKNTHYFIETFLYWRVPPSALLECIEILGIVVAYRRDLHCLFSRIPQKDCLSLLATLKLDFNALTFKDIFQNLVPTFSDKEYATFYLIYYFSLKITDINHFISLLEYVGKDCPRYLVGTLFFYHQQLGQDALNSLYTPEITPEFQAIIEQYKIVLTFLNDEEDSKDMLLKSLQSYYQSLSINQSYVSWAFSFFQSDPQHKQSINKLFQQLSSSDKSSHRQLLAAEFMKLNSTQAILHDKYFGLIQLLLIKLITPTLPKPGEKEELSSPLAIPFAPPLY